MSLKEEAWFYSYDGSLRPIQKEMAERVNSKFGHKKEYLMVEDDMSFMKDAFLNRQLPFPEYLVECGYHHMSRELMESKIKDTMLNKYGHHFMAKYEIPCKGGAIFKVSVISGMMFYSRKDAPYEIMGPSESDNDEDEKDPLGYQTDEQLMIYLAKLIAKAKEY
jgi:hypothetical protein